MTQKIALEGFYVYDNDASNSDDGYMKFIAEVNSDVITGSGKDNAGEFTVDGLYDGKNLRWVKKYPSWQWIYAGKVVEQINPLSSHISGTWYSASNQPQGKFVLTANILLQQ